MVTKPKRHTRTLFTSKHLCYLLNSPADTYREIQWKSQHSAYLSLLLSLCVCVTRSRIARKSYKKWEKGGWDGRYNGALSLLYWPCVQLQAFGLPLLHFNGNAWGLRCHVLKGLHTRHSLLQNNFHSEEDLNSATAKVTGNTERHSWKMSKPLLQYTRFTQPFFF